MQKKFRSIKWENKILDIHEKFGDPLLVPLLI